MLFLLARISFLSGVLIAGRGAASGVVDLGAERTREGVVDLSIDNLENKFNRLSIY